MLPADGGDADAVIEQFRRAGIDYEALAARLQEEGAEAFVQSWDDLLACIARKSEQLKAA
jgi:transaldolase